MENEKIKSNLRLSLKMTVVHTWQIAYVRESVRTRDMGLGM